MDRMTASLFPLKAARPACLGWALSCAYRSAVIILVLQLLLAPAAAWAQPAPPAKSLSTPVQAIAPLDRFETPAEALQADAAEYGRAFGVAPAEALRRLMAQEASAPLIDRLATEYADRLAGIVIEHQPAYRIIINTVGAPAPDMQIALAPFDVPVILRSGALATRVQSLNAIEQHQADLRAALPSRPGMGVDPRTGALLVVTRPSDIDRDDRSAAEARLAQVAGVPVELRSWGDLDENLSIEGGGRIVGADPEGVRHFVCTSGFVVTDGVQAGLATAAHCPDAVSFVDRDGTRTDLRMIGAWGARYQDVQIHVAEVPLAPAFHADSEIRARLALTWRNRASTRAGDVVCHRGQRTGYSCSLVRIVDYAPPGDLCAGPCPATWVAVSGPQCKGGDSGGPVFLGTVAFGLVKGESSQSGTCRLYYYMSTDYLPPGWTVMRPTTIQKPPVVSSLPPD